MRHSRGARAYSASVRVPTVLTSPAPRAGLLVALEGLVLVGLGIVYAVAGVLGDAQSIVGAELGAGLIAASGGLLLLLARALARRRGWARSPVVVVQVLVLLTGLSLLPTGVWPAAVAAMALAVLVLYQLATPGGRQAFR